ncbi:MAG: nucleotide exchange factor GrpE [Candidatus Marinimicrobia bacterium]|nr:nucleotide exchange factor GrpE [Candidatus Neomarinimicrobiota bacterium]
MDDIKLEKLDENFEDKTKKLRDKLKRCQKEKEEYLSGWQRSKADFINTRKKEEEERKIFIKMSNQALLTDILPVLDSFDLAINIKDQAENEIIKGLKMIKIQLSNTLKQYGLEEIAIQNQEEFNPNFHEAIEEIRSKEKSGIIIEEVQKGYTLHGKVLRPAKVKISK